MVTAWRLKVLCMARNVWLEVGESEVEERERWCALKWEDEEKLEERGLWRRLREERGAGQEDAEKMVQVRCTDSRIRRLAGSDRNCKEKIMNR